MRPIDADALKAKLLEERDRIPTKTTERYGFGTEVAYKHGTSMRGGIRKALRCMEETPTLDYAPVVHGEWKYFTTSEKTVHITNWLQCSVCGRMWDRLEGTKYNYCPSCGAKMDGGRTLPEPPKEE